MNEEKAKFILSAYRPGDEDRNDPEFAEALEFARANPGLKAWLEEQAAFDDAARTAFGEIPVPGDLHERIMAGGKVSALPAASGWRRWVASPGIRAMAAALVIGLFVAIAMAPRDVEADGWQAATFSTLGDLYLKRASLDVKSRDAGEIRAWLEKLEPGFAEVGPVLAAVGEAIGCKRVACADGSVTIVCFRHDGKMFHLATHRLPERGERDLPSDLAVAREGKWLAATWENGAYAHMLVTGDESVDPEALRRVIAEFNA